MGKRPRVARVGDGRGEGRGGTSTSREGRVEAGSRRSKRPPRDTVWIHRARVKDGVKVKSDGSPDRRGGKREGAGRPKGKKNYKTILKQELAKRRGKMPHALLCEWAQTGLMDGKPLSTRMRVECAKAAAQYYAPKYMSTEFTGKDRGPIQVEHAMTREQLMEQLKERGLPVRSIFDKARMN